MKSVSLVCLTVAIFPSLPLSAATTGTSPVAATEKADSSDLTVLRARAERGNAIAQYNLGLAHLQGRQTPVSLIEAYAWLSLAAEGGATGRALEMVMDTL